MRYGSKPLEFAKGKNAIKLVSVAEVADVLAKVREAASIDDPFIVNSIVYISSSIIESETGFLCDPQNTDELAKCIDLMFSDGVLR